MDNFFKIFKYIIWNIFAMGLVFISAHAESGDRIVDPDTWERLNINNIKPLNSPFGEHLDLNSGSLSFNTRDVDILGNFDIPVEVRRKKNMYSHGSDMTREFGDWSLDIPVINSKITSYYDNYSNWGRDRLTSWEGAPFPDQSALECTSKLGNGFMYDIPDNHPGTSHPEVIPSHSMWNGDHVSIPGISNEKILTISSQNATKLTKSNYKVECFNRADGTGEGFLITTTEGVEYTFDMPKYVVYVGPPNKSVIAQMRVSKIKDKFGNEVIYEYENGFNGIKDTLGSSPRTTPYYYDAGNLKSITSSDGRKIVFHWKDYGIEERIEKVVAHTGEASRTWLYQYTNGGYLKKVILPDGKSWSFGLNTPVVPAIERDRGGMLKYSKPYYPGYCEVKSSEKDKVIRNTITDPYGTKATFSMKPVLHGRSNFLHDLLNKGMTPSFEPWRVSVPMYINVNCTVNWAVVSKKIEVKGNNDQEWLFSYSENRGGYINEDGKTLRSALPISMNDVPPIIEDLKNYKTTMIINPDGSKTIHYINRNFSSHKEGQTVAIDYFDNDSVTLLKREERTYVLGDNVGWSGVSRENLLPINNRINLTKRKVTNYKSNYPTIYYKEYFDFNEYGVPTRLYEHNSFSSNIKETVTDYKHDKTNWILNLPIKIKVSNNRVDFHTTRQVVYHSENQGSSQYASWSVPYKTYEFGVLTNSYSRYHSDGNRYAVKDSQGNITYYRNYYRGVPRVIDLPGISKDLISEVNSDGTIKSITDYNGYKTVYDYDLMGRIIKITLPLEGGQKKWQDVKMSFGVIDNDDLAIPGLVSGQWKHVTTQGSYRKTSYFDSLLREVLYKEEDLSNNILQKFRKVEFDYAHRPVFRSVLSSYVGESTGTSITYDGLGRVEAIATPAGSTSFSYLTSNRIQKVSPRNFTTTYTYQAFGEPNYNYITNIKSPENIVTNMKRDVYGKLKSITQSGAGASFSRSYYYDSRQKLCRMYNPETGYTAMHYNNEGLLSWERVDTHSNFCNQSDVPSGATKFTYDPIGNLTKVNYPLGTLDLDFVYDNNGNMTYASRGSVKWSYAYNNLNKLSSETLNIDGRSFSASYGYDGRGQLNEMIYPSGRQLGFLTNAYGQPTRAGNYAYSAQYYPTGELRQFIYGNNRMYTMVLNDELFPETVGVSNRAQVTYGYDANANITSITDHIISSENKSMIYDGLDRLDSASGPWGTSSFVYDSLGNIKNKQLGSKSYNYNYSEKTNLLTSVTGSKTYQFEYDVNGNVQSNGHHNFHYDKANLLLSVNNGNVANFNYDAHKRRVKVTEDDKTIYQFYTLSGQLLHKYNLNSNQPEDYIYMKEKNVAKVEGWPGQQGPVAPSFIDIVEGSTEGTFSISWPASMNATYYRLQERKNNGGWINVQSISERSKAFSDKPSGDYQYQVRSCNSNGCSQYRVSKIFSVDNPVISTPGKPTNITAPSTDNDGYFVVSWSLVSGAERYVLQQKKGSGIWRNVFNDTGTMYLTNSLSSGSYYYRVRACNSVGCGSYSSIANTNVISVPTPKPCNPVCEIEP